MKREYLARLLWLVLVCRPGLFARASCDGHARLDPMERASLIAAAEGSRPEISAELLAEPGCFQQMLDEVHALGAQDRFTDRKVGYAWVMLPKEKVLDVQDFNGLSEAWASTSEYEYRMWDAPPTARKPTIVPSFTILIPRVALYLPADGPYFPVAEAGISQLWKDRPTADGRGVKVALFDEGLDLFHLALREALDRDGQPVPKVADIFPFSRPGEAAGWVQFGAPLDAVNGNLSAVGRNWRVPYQGVFSFGIFNARIYFGAWIPGSSPGPAPQSIALTVGVLWDAKANRVWVDTNGDGSFLDQKPLGDYALTHDTDYFGTLSGEGDNRLPFGVKIDSSNRAAYLSLTGGAHATAVAGTLAANRATGGLYDGAAPNAQLVDVRGGSLNNKVAAVLATLARSDVDLLNHSGIFLRSAPAGGIEEEFDRHVLDRATTAYDKPISCLCFSRNAISVDDYQSAEMLRRNRQTKPPYSDTVSVLLRPDSDGLLNALVAPSAMLATQSRYVPMETRNSEGRITATFGADSPPGSPAPDGYWIGNNPSPTIPYAAGIMADLISEARRLHIRFNANRLVEAVLLGTRRLDRFPLSEQARGVIDANAAWAQLNAMAKADDPSSAELTSFVVEEGSGAHRQRIEGFRADFPSPLIKRTVRLWITRVGGYRTARRYRLRLRGNDGTFRLLSQQVELTAGEAAPVQLSYVPARGQHLAFLQLVDFSVGVVMHEVPLYERSNAGKTIAAGVERYVATLPPLSADYEFEHLDPIVQAARFVMRIPNAGQGRYSDRLLPNFSYRFGKPEKFARERENQKTTGARVDPLHHVGPIEQFQSLIANQGGAGPTAATEPYVYLVGWSNGGGIEYATPDDDPVPDVPIAGTLTITKYAVRFSRRGQRVLAFNRFADINGRVEFFNAEVSSGRLTGEGPHSQATIDRKIPAHVAQWRVRISPALLDHQAADAFLFNCAVADDCEMVAQSTIEARDTTVTVSAPREGRWRLLLRTRNAVKQTVIYNIREALLFDDVAASEKSDSRHSHHARWAVNLPTSDRTGYAAFRIAGTPGVDSEKDGLRVAVTPLSTAVP